MAKTPRACILVLRLLSMAAAVSAAVVMATSHQTTSFFNIAIKAEFYHSPSFTFFLAANAVAGVYSLFPLLAPRAGLGSRWVVVLDVVVAMLLTAAVAAAGAISEVGKKGNEHAGWLPICGQVSKYCHHVMGALICGFVGLLCHTTVVLHTISTELDPLLP
ncbi:hypothetical protein HPP92_003496 [Vanilla planifolia]|uniref:CASP-like protein n=1 Tax=Vanilla planifolia TaxID=51239 RepID=A0A835VJV2_VANPL|nr:hypothetical protein HPP92_003887 [Vanilla planifolia]KAG0503424.1 hypothetical protein HPP92_003496 [Vanilla planifolia]